jgi:hypothetical protein
MYFRITNFSGITGFCGCEFALGLATKITLRQF